MRQLLFIILFSVLISGCKSKNEYVELVIDNTKIDSVHDISKLVGRIIFTPLHEVEGNRIGDVFIVRRVKNYFLIYDRLRVNKIFLFDNQGKFIKTVIKTGFGKEDAVNINDFWLNNSG